MDAGELEAERSCLKQAQVRVSIEAVEQLGDAGQLDVAEIAGRNRELADLLELAHLAGVVEEGQALVVSRRIREQEAVVIRELLLDATQSREVVVHLLDGDEVEPAEDLGEQRVVVLAAVLDAEVGDVPGREEQPVGRLRRDLPPRLGIAVATQSAELRRHAVVVGEVWLRERRHQKTNGALQAGS
jgi:hypothetical protein